MTFNFQLQNIDRLVSALRLVWYSSRNWTIARIVLMVLQGILPLFAIYLTKLIVDTVAASLTTPDKVVSFQQVLLLLGLAAIVMVVMTLCSTLTELVNPAQAQRVTDYMQGLIHAKSIEADLEYYENARYYDALRRAQREAPYRPSQILNRLAQVGQNGISLLAMVGLLLSLHWGIIGLLVVAAIPAVLVRLKYSQINYQWQRQHTQLERQGMYLGLMLTGDQFAKEVRLFDLGPLFCQRYLALRQRIYQEKLAIATGRFVRSFAAQAIAGIFIFAVFAFIAYQTVQGVLQVGDLVLYYQALQRGQTNLTALLSNLSGLYEDTLFLSQPL